MRLARGLWAAGASVQLETRGVALKKAMTTANRTGIRTVLILGDGELDAGTVTVKHMATGEQETWPLAELATNLKNL
jgi:histidyl-tRNA synthetase